MNQFDENELRKKIRLELEKKHQQKKNVEKIEPDLSKKGKIELTPALKKAIKRIEEERLFSNYNQFVKCSNHLGEIAWFTALELAEQHEFFPVEESRWNLFKKKFSSADEKKLPSNDEIDQYRETISHEIEESIQKRLEKYEKQIKEHEPDKKQNRIDDIISQEEQRFYSSHPDYKLYQNYAGKTKWLTNEEFKNEEEYTDRILTQKEKIIRNIVWSIGIILVIAIGYFVLNYNWNPANVGYIVINVNQQNGLLYIDDKLMLGFTNNQPLPLSVGSHYIYYRKAGFSTAPNFRNIEIALNDTSKISFLLTSQIDTSKGVVNIKSQYDDAKVFINDDFFGLARSNPKIFLPPGSYIVELKKENFTTSPVSSSIDLSRGDSIDLSFKFITETIGQRKSKTNVKSALLEVASNVEGAHIFIDGKDSGEKTNYIFNNLPFGEHVVSLKHEGFNVSPAEKVIQLSSNQSLAKAYFKLNRTTMPVTITTRPVPGSIYIDGKEVGVGTWTGSLSIGEHAIDFSKIGYFLKPQVSKLIISEDKSANFTFTYQPDFSITFTPDGVKPDNVNGTIQLGYIDENNNFSADPNNGPKIRRTEYLPGDVWWMANAFNFRTPPANEAVAVSFNLPQQSEFGYNFIMKLWGYQSDQSYPLEISSPCNIRIEVNGEIIQNSYTPRYNLAEASDSKYERFQLGNLLHTGRNRIIVSTAKTNKRFFALRKISVE